MVEFLLADLLYQTLRSVWNEEGILHGVSFLEASPRLERIEVVDERTVLHPRAEELKILVEAFLPSF